MLKDNLNSIYNRFSVKCKRELVLEDCIKKKLRRTTESYFEDIEKSCSYLLTRSNLKVLKYLSQKIKRDDKKKETTNE